MAVPQDPPLRRAAGPALLLCLALTTPASAEDVPLGRSTEGRAIGAVRLGDPDSPRKVLVVGAIHGNEVAGMRVTRALRKRGAAEGVDLWVVDTVNPDGVARGTRGNSRGVDLNRNFPRRWRRSSRRGPYYSGKRPLSEREARIVARLIERIRPAVTIWYHQPWGAVLLPCSGPAPLERLYMDTARFPGERCRGAGLRGTATSWQRHEFGSTAFVVELPRGGISARAAERHARAAAAVAAGG